MKLAILLGGATICLAATPAFATQQSRRQTWSGFLVDSGCYEALERNTNPWDTSTYVDRDREREIRYCAPGAKTKSFTLVDRDGLSHKLDFEGAAKAAELVRRAGKKDPMAVTLEGEQREKEIQVDSIELAK